MKNENRNAFRNAKKNWENSALVNFTKQDECLVLMGLYISVKQHNATNYEKHMYNVLSIHY